MSGGDMSIGAVLLAAGQSSRFGGNKLLADFGGRPVVCRAMEAVRELAPVRRVIVTGNEEIAALAKTYGFAVISNRQPELGLSRSIHLGVESMADLDAVLLLTGDQPLLTGKTLKRLCSQFKDGEKGIACLRDGTHSGNPAILSNRYFPKLLALEGDCGAKGILRANEQDLTVVSCSREDELEDCDTPQALASLIQRMRTETI